MASFTDHEIDRHEWDLQMLRNGGISLYLRHELLQADLQWLRSRDYEIRKMQCDSWSSWASMHDAVASTLKFPAYYGRNLNALSDCICEDLKVSLSGGLAVVLMDVKRRAAISDVIETVLDIFANASRHYMLTGKRLIVLVQSNDPLIRFHGLAAVNA